MERLSAGQIARTAIVGAVTLSTLVLAGCAPQPRPEPLTPAEIAAYERGFYDMVWQSTGLADSARPTGDLGAYVSVNEFDKVMPACMAAAATSPEFEMLRYYNCMRAFPLSPADQGFFSGAELDALYEYFQDDLVPCLEVRGVHVSSAPARWHANGEPGEMPWNPYWTLAQEGIEFSHVEDDCPALPPWALGD